MPTSTSGITTWSSNRDQIINRALRIIGAIGETETGTSTQISNAAIALNDLVKEWNSVHGMPLWKIVTVTVPLVSGKSVYTIGKNAGFDINAEAPLRMIHAYYRDVNTSTDIAINIITRDQYNWLSDKTSSGYPSQAWYNPPGNLNSNATPNGSLTIFQVPDATTVANVTNIYIVGPTSFEDFNASTDLPDFPSSWYNALTWGLADQLSYEYGVAFAERSMITKKKDEHLEAALEGSTEEGSIFFQPNWVWLLLDQSNGHY